MDQWEVEFLWTLYWTFRFHKRRWISWLTGRLVASQGRFCSMNSDRQSVSHFPSMEETLDREVWIQIASKFKITTFTKVYWKCIFYRIRSVTLLQEFSLRLFRLWEASERSLVWSYDRTPDIFCSIDRKISPWSRVPLQKLTVAQLVKKLLTFIGTRRFITMFIRVCKFRDPVQHFVTIWFSMVRRCYPLARTLQAGRPPLVGCQVLVLQYICTYPPYLQAVSPIEDATWLLRYF